jgi:uncharacterized YkwD family protein
MKKLLYSTIAAAALFTFSFGGQKTEAHELQTKIYIKTINGQYQPINIDSENIEQKIKEYFPNIQINSKEFQKLIIPSNSTTTKTEVPTNIHKGSDQKANSTPIKETNTVQPKQNNQSKTSYSIHEYERKVVELTNIERQKQGLKPLQIDENLSKVAREKSLDMQRNNYFSHTSPTYGSPFEMMNKFGITYKTAGENIAKGQRTPEEVVQAWMNSDGHRKNILNPNFTHIGVGYSENGKYWTQMFIGK